jgi:hypothetical protein
MVDIEALATEIGPAVMAAINAYGTAVLTKAEDAAAGETVRLGQRLLAKLLGRAKSRAGIEGAVTDVADAVDDPDFQAGLRAQIKKALREDSELAAELVDMLPESARQAVTASGERAIAVGGDSSGINSTGDGARNIFNVDEVALSETIHAHRPAGRYSARGPNHRGRSGQQRHQLFRRLRDERADRERPPAAADHANGAGASP